MLFNGRRFNENVVYIHKNERKVHQVQRRGSAETSERHFWIGLHETSRLVSVSSRSRLEIETRPRRDLYWNFGDETRPLLELSRRDEIKPSRRNMNKILFFTLYNLKVTFQLMFSSRKREKYSMWVVRKGSPDKAGYDPRLRLSA